MAVVAAFCPLSLQTLFDSNALPIVGGQIFTYDAGTTNPRPVFQDAALTSALPFPALTDAYGRIPPIFVGLGAYKAVLKDAAGAQISVIDGLPGGVDDDAGLPPVVGTVIPTGFVTAAHTDDVVDGWLPLNGKTIGPASSPATGRANADVQALFTKLWNKDASLTVLGGRGLSATADWTAAKTIALPDYRGKAPIGADGMGNTLAGVVTSASTSTPNVVGTILGAEAVSLTSDELAAHTHGVTVQSAGGHTHTGSTDADGSHSHTGTTDSGGAHTHTYTDASTTQVGRSGLDSQAYAPAAGTSTTSVSGTHTHTLTIGGGQHSHALNVNAVGDHTHTASESSVGTGEAHPNMPPAVVVFWHIKL